MIFMALDETRKRYLVAGVVVGAVGVGLFVLAKKVPRDKWGETLGRIAQDGFSLVKARYGNNEAVRMAETALKRVLHSDDEAKAIG
jgi:hypothetical protein